MSDVYDRRGRVQESPQENDSAWAAVARLRRCHDVLGDKVNNSLMAVVLNAELIRRELAGDAFVEERVRAIVAAVASVGGAISEAMRTIDEISLDLPPL